MNCPHNPKADGSNPPRNQRNHRGLGTLRAPGTVVDLPIHCKIFQTCCNAIQTLLQVNSNGLLGCAFQGYSAVWREMAGNRGKWRDMVGFVASKFDETRPICAELIFSAAGFDLCNCLILRE